MVVDKARPVLIEAHRFCHRMTITSTKQIAQLKACGVQTLTVRVEAEVPEEAPTPSTPEDKPIDSANELPDRPHPPALHISAQGFRLPKNGSIEPPNDCASLYIQDVRWDERSMSMPCKLSSVI